ncbi:hypothetical protein PROPHIT462_87 [Mycobacterium phage prophiT46-2]|uniref:hypothetical protein n=1 Tax=Mycobacteroides abscessus TaxID=36809 RepID=UPI00232C7514|nr:hypothetical protein [Mycobacteroides abscessus]MDB2219127.1 hypothetical protein [Mycobacteroides abscessus subsp. abscessus]WJJ56281.1 hypothetical protein PROPHIT462_87 [Mycobacterium phage prophiT46-2]
MVIKARIAQWREELFDSIGKQCAAVVRELLTKFLNDFRQDARAEVAAVARKADESVDKLTDAIPGTLDDRLFDGRFGQLLQHLEQLVPLFGGGSR